MTVPITSELTAYTEFWQFWFGLLVTAVSVVGLTVIVLLALILRRLGQ